LGLAAEELLLDRPVRRPRSGGGLQAAQRKGRRNGRREAGEGSILAGSGTTVDCLLVDGGAPRSSISIILVPWRNTNRGEERRKYLFCTSGKVCTHVPAYVLHMSFFLKGYSTYVSGLKKNC
jgi:hypothetical protein